ncbi:hypothetical protein [Persicobacter psychrovividus]|uniref:DUF2116 family Zn-ribbon domain-containing protein n=1 Tax=Persicobacter psychrovividus TaxID=387638 RepID=A0ABM7VJI9_9BACT|nr:hypothetical protein PEPS_34380 [Persicobacter psychrovividus]
MINLNKGECKYCLKGLTAGRTDRKFCDAKCRSAYHNNRRTVEFAIENTQLKIIRHNRGILKKLSPEGKGIVRKEVLDAHGFNFEAFSRIYITNQNKVYYFSFEYGYSAILEGHTKKVIIVKFQDYMNNYHFDPWRKIKPK